MEEFVWKKNAKEEGGPTKGFKSAVWLAAKHTIKKGCGCERVVTGLDEKPMSTHGNGVKVLCRDSISVIGAKKFQVARTAGKWVKKHICCLF